MDEFDREAIRLVADLSAFMPGFAEMNAQQHDKLKDRIAVRFRGAAYQHAIKVGAHVAAETPTAIAGYDKLLSHLKDHTCAGDGELYRWLLGWIAHVVSAKGHRGGIPSRIRLAPVLRGPRGAGKTIIGKIIGRLLAAHGAADATASLDLNQVSYFTLGAIIQNRLLLVESEAMEMAHAGPLLKKILCERFINVEFKGQGPCTVRNIAQPIFFGDEEWIPPAGMDERSLVIIDVRPISDSASVTQAAWKDILNQLDAGGYAALFQFLVRADLPDPNYRPHRQAITGPQDPEDLSGASKHETGEAA